MIDFFNTHIDPASKTRAKIATHLLAQAKSSDVTETTASSEEKNAGDETTSTINSERRVEAQLREVGSPEKIEDVRRFKASMPLSEAMRPVRELTEFEDFGAKL